VNDKLLERIERAAAILEKPVNTRMRLHSQSDPGPEINQRMSKVPLINDYNV